MSRSAPTHAPDATVRADAALRRLAHRRVALTTGWCVHALVYLLVNAGLWAGAAVADAGRLPWSPLWGWGLGLGVHGTVTLALLVAGGLHARGLSRAMGGLRRVGGDGVVRAVCEPRPSAPLCCRLTDTALAGPPSRTP